MDTLGYKCFHQFEMKLFESSVTSIACFVARHRNIRQRDIRILAEAYTGTVRVEFIGPALGMECCMYGTHERD